MTNLEFSNEFDVLYNNITSNQAPGLDEYEKSVFLTKAQDEIVKAYFNPKSNKVQEGFDGNERRQIDFSMIMRSVRYENSPFFYISDDIQEAPTPDVITSPSFLTSLILKQKGYLTNEQVSKIDSNYIKVISGPTASGRPTSFSTTPFLESFFDYRNNTRSVALDENILMFVNEYVSVVRDSHDTRLVVVPINYTEYSRLIGKPYKRPLKNQAWRLLDNSDGNKKAEIIVGPNDIIQAYAIRYVKRPRAIRLTTFDDVTLDGESTEQSCELDPILHTEILQRAVELAKAAYTGDLTSQIALGQTSQTNMGVITQSR